MKPLISVIIPTYNYAPFVADAVRSVREQSFPDWECLVVDDGSTDNTRQIVEEISAGDPRVKYFHQQNRGLSAARNRGIGESSGNFLQFLDSDDLVEFRKLELQLEFLLDHPEVDIVYGDMRYFPGDQPHARLHSVRRNDEPWMPRISGSGKELVKLLLKDNIMVVNCPLLRRQVIDACGLFDESLNANEDWEYWIRCALKGCSFAYLELPETLALVRYHPASMSRDNFRMLDAKLHMHRKLAALLTDGELVSANEKEIGQVALLEAVERIRCGHRFAGFFQLVRLSFRNLDFEYLPYGIKLFVLGK